MKLNACDIVYGNYLAHFGILGMKWGVRRYQNKDGSLTEAGKKRYSVNSLHDFYQETVKQRNDKNAQKRFKKLINNGSEDSKMVTERHNQRAKDADILNKAFDKYIEEYEKKYGEFTGDGTEAHYALEKEFPEYKKLSDKLAKSSKEYAQTLIALSGKGFFDEAFRNMPDFKDQYKDWYKRIDGKAVAAAEAFSKIYGTESFFPEDLTTWAPDGGKEKLQYFD